MNPENSPLSILPKPVVPTLFKEPPEAGAPELARIAQKRWLSSEALRVCSAYGLADLGSMNRTSLNGATIQARREVLPGDAIKFGAVHCVACTGADLWRAMHAPRAA